MAIETSEMTESTDKIRNYWRMRKGVMVVDIETNYSKNMSEQGKRNRHFKCGVVYSYDEEKYYKFTDPIELVKLLKKSKGIVTYNGEGFDFLVLNKYGLRLKKYKNRWRPSGIKSFDIMHTIQERRLKKTATKNTQVLMK